MIASAVEATAAWMSVMVQWRMMPYLIESRIETGDRQTHLRLAWLALTCRLRLPSSAAQRQRLPETHQAGWLDSFPTDRVMGILIAKLISLHAETTYM